MSAESLNLILTQSILIDHENIDYEKALSSLREFRSAVASGGVQFQMTVFKNESIIPILFDFVEKMFRVQPPHPNSTLAFSIGVQCIVNLMSNNDAIRNYFAENYVKNIIMWLKTEGCKQQNYVCAALLNIDQVGKLRKELDNVGFVRDLITVAESEAEFGVLLLQNLLNSHCFCQLYEAAQEEQRFFLLQLLESMMAETNGEFVEEFTFISSKFKKSCDGIMSIIPSIGSSAALELALMLEFLSSASYKSGYIATLQSDSSLIINSAYLLRGIHEVVSQQKTWKESLKEAVESIKETNSELAQRPFFGVKGNLIRLLGNLAYKHRGNQDQIREAGCIPIILDSCKLDGENPFIKEWSILTIRNLCDGNSENQTFIKNMDYQGCDLGVMQEMSLTLNDGEGNSINIAPVLRR